ncbi:hypothetical protein B566_EDAN018902, partial [Ephemera danica]
MQVVRQEASVEFTSQHNIRNTLKIEYYFIATTMGLPNAINYVLYDNPICRGAADYLVKGASMFGITKKAPHVAEKSAKMMSTAAGSTLSELTRSNGLFIRIAGLSGAAAVALGAYGAH